MLPVLYGCIYLHRRNNKTPHTEKQNTNEMQILADMNGIMWKRGTHDGRVETPERASTHTSTSCSRCIKHAEQNVPGVLGPWFIHCRCAFFCLSARFGCVGLCLVVVSVLVLSPLTYVEMFKKASLMHGSYHGRGWKQMHQSFISSVIVMVFGEFCASNGSFSSSLAPNCEWYHHCQCIVCVCFFLLINEPKMPLLASIVFIVVLHF